MALTNPKLTQNLTPTGKEVQPPVFIPSGAPGATSPSGGGEATNPGDALNNMLLAMQLSKMLQARGGTPAASPLGVGGLMSAPSKTPGIGGESSGGFLSLF